MYLICDVPEGAVDLYFTILNTAEFDKVVLSNSEKIEDMEPDWVEEDSYLCGAVGSSVVGEKLRACVTGGSTTGNMTWADFHYYSQQRGMQQIDALMHFWIANLFYAAHGRRDAQEECGAGSHDYNRKTGGTMERGMTETLGYEAAKAIKADVTNSLVDGLVHQYAWYEAEGDYGSRTMVQVNNTCCLGYEDIYGNKYDMMDGVDLPNDSGNAGKWRVWLPDGTTVMIKGTTNSDWWTTAVAHSKYMAVIPVGSVNGSSSTYYSDKYWMSTAAGRVVYRGYYNAVAFGGVSNVSCVLPCFVCGYACRLASGLPRKDREGGERGGVQGDERGGVKRSARKRERSDKTCGSTGEAGRKILEFSGCGGCCRRFVAEKRLILRCIA